jgi:hypothetical protein
VSPHVPRPSRAVVAGAGLLALVGLTGAVALPAAHGDADAGAASAMRSRLERVAQAQDAWRAGHGRYTDRLEDLGVDPDGDLAIVHADATGFCVGAHDAGSESVVFYSPTHGFSTTSCR